MEPLAPPIPARARSRGFTLLELVLAISALAAITGMIATLWSQAGSWTAESALHERAMRLPRVLELMRSQWADRRTSVPIDPGGATVLAEPGRLEFLTATPVLFPDWPLVRAAYVVERDYEAPAWQADAYRLVYEETRIADMREKPSNGSEGEGAVGAWTGQESMRTHLLLGRCTRMAWERFGRESDALDPERIGERPRRAGERPADRARTSSPGSGRAAPLPGIAAADEGNPDAPPEQRIAPAWVEYRDQVRQRPPAVRVHGVYEGQEFTCVFVIGDSR